MYLDRNNNNNNKCFTVVLNLCDFFTLKITSKYCVSAVTILKAFSLFFIN